AAPDRLLDLLAHPASSPRYRFRTASPLELRLAGLNATGHSVAWTDLHGRWTDANPLVGQLELRPRRSYGARGRARRPLLPLVIPEVIPAGRSVPGVVRVLADRAGSDPGRFQRSDIVDEIAGFPADSLLLRLATRALQLALGDVGRSKQGVTGSGLEPVVA